MRDIGNSNRKILEKYQQINESKKGYRRKVQLIDDRIDDLIDDIEKKIQKEEENPVYQRRLYQMLADMNKEHGEFLMSIKRIAGTIDSGAKTIPQAKGEMNPNNQQGYDEQPPANAVGQPQPGQPGTENNVNEATDTEYLDMAITYLKLAMKQYTKGDFKNGASSIKSAIEKSQMQIKQYKGGSPGRMTQKK